MLSWRHAGTDPFKLYHSYRREGKEAIEPANRKRYRSFMFAIASAAQDRHERELASIFGGTGNNPAPRKTNRGMSRRK